jgi:hypothetical protein
MTSNNERPLYLFALIDGGTGVYSTRTELTPGDIEHSTFGQAEIIRLSDLHYLNRDGRWLPIPAGILTEPDGIHAPYHLPPSYFTAPTPTKIPDAPSNHSSDCIGAFQRHLGNFSKP